jgi:hypothetical protein
MATLTRDRQTRTTTGPGAVEPGPERRGWAAVVLALVAVIAVAATMFAVFGGDGGGDVGTRPAESEDDALGRLVNEGYIPSGTRESPSSDADAAGSESLGSVMDSARSSDQRLLERSQDTERSQETDRSQNEGLIPQ